MLLFLLFLIKNDYSISVAKIKNSPCIRKHQDTNYLRMPVRGADIAALGARMRMK